MGTSAEARNIRFCRRAWQRIGATIIGRRLFDLTDGWGGKPAVGDRVFVVTHRDCGDWSARYPEAPYEFVTDGLQAAVKRAKEFAGDRDVSITAGDLAGQALLAGLVDEIEMHLVPVVFGTGVRFFGKHEVPQTLLGDPDIVAGNRVTHLHYKIQA
ncbi:dihydrofolate reductase family protein [Nocardia brasiliensis]|uniref:dihydrofolate reductase family protein n=1 Tax=Nocardia brasiliensis TaxID=37326 RepID=UPI003D89B249